MKRLVIASALVALTAAGCAGRKEVTPPPPVDEPGEHVIAIQDKPVPVAQQMAGQTDVTEMVVTDSGIEPKILATTVGGKVKIHLRNKGSKEHNLIVPEFGIVTSNLGPGQENYIEFTANKKGTWAFFSDAPGKAEPGLAGSLKVE